MFPEGCEGGDTGDVGLVRAGGHVTEWLQLPLRAVVTDVAVEHRGWRILDDNYYNYNHVSCHESDLLKFQKVLF